MQYSIDTNYVRDFFYVPWIKYHCFLDFSFRKGFFLYIFFKFKFITRLSNQLTIEMTYIKNEGQTQVKHINYYDWLKNPFKLKRVRKFGLQIYIRLKIQLQYDVGTDDSQLNQIYLLKWY